MKITGRHFCLNSEPCVDVPFLFQVQASQIWMIKGPWCPWLLGFIFPLIAVYKLQKGVGELTLKIIHSKDFKLLGKWSVSTGGSNFFFCLLNPFAPNKLKISSFKQGFAILFSTLLCHIKYQACYCLELHTTSSMAITCGTCAHDKYYTYVQNTMPWPCFLMQCEKLW